MSRLARMQVQFREKLRLESDASPPSTGSSRSTSTSVSSSNYHRSGAVRGCPSPCSSSSSSSSTGISSRSLSELRKPTRYEKVKSETSKPNGLSLKPTTISEQRKYTSIAPSFSANPRMSTRSEVDSSSPAARSSALYVNEKATSRATTITPLSKVSFVPKTKITSAASMGSSGAMAAKSSASRSYSSNGSNGSASRPEPRATTARVVQPKVTDGLKNAHCLVKEKEKEKSGFCCRVCGRSFALLERLTRHESVCEKTVVKQRKLFNSTNQRFKGQPSEYVQAYKRGLKNPEKSEKKSNNWRMKHEYFIAAIRAAKGGPNSASGPSTSDILSQSQEPCKFCGRRFKEDALERHQPICERLFIKNQMKGKTHPKK